VSRSTPDLAGLSGGLRGGLLGGVFGGLSGGLSGGLFRRRLPLWPRRSSRRTVFVRPEGVHELTTPAAEGGPDFADLPHWLAAHPACDVCVLLSARLVHPLLVRDPALAAASEEDRRAWAAQQFAQVYGPEATQWPLVLWSDPPVLAVMALHGASLPAWREAATAQGSRLLSVQPWWSVMPAHAAAEAPGWPGAGDASLLLVEGGHAAWLAFHDGRLCGLEQRRADDASALGLAALCQEWQSEMGPFDRSRCVAAGFGALADAAGSQALQAHCRVLGDLSVAWPEARWMQP
jgi:hypothetical protein